jgi:hypothetical protein
MTRPIHEWLLAGVAAVGVASLTAWWSAPTEGRDDGLVAERAPRGALPPTALEPARSSRPDLPVGAGQDERHRGLAGREPWPAPPAQALAAWGGRPPVPRVAAARSTAPAASATIAAPPPAPPPLRWRYVGRILDAGSMRAVLVHASQGTAVVGATDTVEGQWRVESIRDDAVELLWLPGGVRQSLMAPA